MVRLYRSPAVQLDVEDLVGDPFHMGAVQCEQSRYRGLTGIADPEPLQVAGNTLSGDSRHRFSLPGWSSALPERCGSPSSINPAGGSSHLRMCLPHKGNHGMG
jgi:hypothetical protein